MSMRLDGKAILFDLDGTLIDSAPDLAGAVERMRERRGLTPIPVDRYRPWAGSGARGMLWVGFELTPTHSEYESFRDEFYGEYQAGLLNETRVFDGVAELIEGLANLGLPWGVVTNKAERFALPLLDGLKALNAASVVICGDTTPHAKPHPAPLLEAARRLNLAPEHCIYVGDDERDIVAGRAAHMRTVAARYGYLGADADIAAWQADAEVNHPHGVLKFFEVP